jgi:hypothetical protein
MGIMLAAARKIPLANIRSKRQMDRKRFMASNLQQAARIVVLKVRKQYRDLSKEFRHETHRL